MKIAVIILTYNRNEMLKRCLDSIVLNQSKLPDEIIIVNAGDDSVKVLIDVYRDYDVDIRVIKTGNISLADNRNAGVLESSCDLVAFTDDDCEVCSDWVQKYINVFNSNKKIGSAGGNAFDGNKYVMAHTIEQIALLNEDSNNTKYSPHSYYFCTRNVCFKKKILEEVGMFETTYRKSFEDVIAGVKILQAGYENIYYPDIYVKHFGRDRLYSVIKRFFEYGRDMYIGTIRFRHLKMAYVFKAQSSLCYLFLSSFAGPLKDVIKYWKKINPILLIVCSLILKISLNSGMIYERYKNVEAE